MKILYSIIATVSLLFLTGTVRAQETLADSLSGYYRLTTPAYGDAFHAAQKFSIDPAALSLTDAGSIVRLQTSKAYTLQDELAELQRRLDAGEIDTTQYSQLFQQALTLSAWKSGCYPVRVFRIQGVDYAQFVADLADYTDDAIESFLNTGADSVYTKWQSSWPLIGIFTSIMYPKDYATLTDFKNWCEKLITQARNITDFTIFMQPEIQSTDAGGVYTGNYYLKFKTPAWIGNLKKAQIYMNSILTNNGANKDVDTFNIWGSVKEAILGEIAKKYPAGSDAYNLAEQIFGNTEVDMVYCIGETEQGKLYAQPLPDTFGSNGVNLTADDIQRIVWKLSKVDADQPFAVAPQEKAADGSFYTTLYTDFPMQLTSAGTQAYYVTSVDANTGIPTLQEVPGNKIPALTPVIIKSSSASAQDNQILPLDEDVAPIEGNVLKGVLFSAESDGTQLSLSAGDGLTFTQKSATLSANSAYYDGAVAAGISSVRSDANHADAVYDLQGRKVSSLVSKGIYIINGHKVVR